MVNSVVGDPGYGVLLMYGNASYTRWCNGAVHPLVGDVIGVTAILAVAVLLRGLERWSRRLNSKYSGLACCASSAVGAVFH